MSRLALRLGWLLGTVFIQGALADGPRLTVSVGADAETYLKKEIPSLTPVSSLSSLSTKRIFQLDENDLYRLSHLMHEKFGRCGGFFVEDAESLQSFDETPAAEFQMPLGQFDENAIRATLAGVSDVSIKQTIDALSRFQNRYYRSTSGSESQKWLASQWREITSGREGIEIKEFKHAQWTQPSIVLTWKGSESPNELIVLGGHGDSINQSGFDPSLEEDLEMNAPGADDNASGVSTLTEVLRVLISSGFVPKKTIQFISYAAEEVGLRGSSEIASQYKSERRNVRGAIQLDMTNYSRRLDEMILITDYTHATQNDYVQNLIQKYLPQITVRRDTCGYACSDHASWSRNGFPVSFPFESRTNEYNPAIHTSDDTLNQSQQQAVHAAKFAKLVVAYAMEMGS